MSDDPDLARLIEDARRVAGYGQRAGRLSDTRLFTALQKVDALGVKSWAAQEVIELQAALNAAAMAIAPVTLHHLCRENFDPFRRKGYDPEADAEDNQLETRSSAVRLAFIALSICLLIVTCHYTVWHKRATALLNDFDLAHLDVQSVIVDDLVVRYLSDAMSSPSTKGDMTGLWAVTLVEKVGKLRDLEQRIWSNEQQYGELAAAFWLIGGGRAQDDRGVYMAANAETPSIPGVEEENSKSKTAFERVGACMHLPQSMPPGSDDADPVPREVAFEPAPPSVAVQKFGTNVVDYDEMHDVFRCIVGLPKQGSDAFPAQFSTPWQTLRQRTEVMGLMVLPALYGILGAMLFFMRSYLNPLFPNPQVARVVLRVFVAALLGISIGWFWSPTEILLGTEVQVAPISKLVIAFLAGFAIEVFFTFLDRIVQVSNAGIARWGTAT